MRYLEAGGARLSVIGLGTWQFGAAEWGYGEGYAGRAGEIVARALELGVNLFDTAEIYAFGRSERILGAALSGHRRDTFIATKLLPLLPITPVISARARGSARRLGVEQLDLYQMHGPSPHVPLSHTMAALRRLLDAGRILHVGVSNYSLARWQRAEAALGRPVLSNQVAFSLVNRGPAADLVPYAAARDRVVIAYSPLGQGFLSGAYRNGARPEGRMRQVNPRFNQATAERNRGLLDALAEIAGRHSATAAQVALAWVIHHPNTAAIPGARTAEQMSANAAAADLELDDEEFARLSLEAGRSGF